MANEYTDEQKLMIILGAVFGTILVCVLLFSLGYKCLVARYAKNFEGLVARATPDVVPMVRPAKRSDYGQIRGFAARSDSPGKKSASSPRASIEEVKPLVAQDSGRSFTYDNRDYFHPDSKGQKREPALGDHAASSFAGWDAELEEEEIFSKEEQARIWEELRRAEEEARELEKTLGRRRSSARPAIEPLAEEPELEPDGGGRPKMSEDYITVEQKNKSKVAKDEPKLQEPEETFGFEEADLEEQLEPLSPSALTQGITHVDYAAVGSPDYIAPDVGVAKPVINMGRPSMFPGSPAASIAAAAGSPKDKMRNSVVMGYLDGDTMQQSSAASAANPRSSVLISPMSPYVDPKAAASPGQANLPDNYVDPGNLEPDTAAHGGSTLPDDYVDPGNLTTPKKSVRFSEPDVTEAATWYGAFD